jgi:riboflavin biosynthesis pyrimidine reductase
LFDIQDDSRPMIPELREWYGGGLSLPEARGGMPGVYSNFVTSLDGRITFNQPGHFGGGDISYRNPADRLVMALLRCHSDAILVGAGTLRVEPKHVWTAQALVKRDPAVAALFARQRAELGLPARYLHFFVTGSGRVNPNAAVLNAPDAEVWFITTPAGKAALESQFPDGPPRVIVPGDGPEVDMAAALQEMRERFGVNRLLCEGGPTVIGSLIQGRLLHGAFLSTAPQIIGNAPSEDDPDRPTWVSHYYGTPGQTPSAKLLSLKLDPDRRLQFAQYGLEYPLSAE